MTVATITAFSNMGTTVTGFSTPNENLTISNPSGRYLKLRVMVGAYYYEVGIGNVTSYNFVFSYPTLLGIYQNITDSNEFDITWRLKSYVDSGYATQDGADQDYNRRGSIAQSSAVSPTFTTATIENVDKTIVVKDKYDNTLISSSTATLIGNSDANLIAGISKFQCVVAVANKAVARYYATMSYYSCYTRLIKEGLTDGYYYTSEGYSDDSDVEFLLDFDNINYIGATLDPIAIQARDSRDIYTQIIVPPVLTLDYASVSIYNVVATRDNVVDALTKLSFDGAFWKKYFSSGTMVDPGHGVLNAIVAEYRFKETSEAWGAQTWSEISPDTTDGVISFDDYVSGDLGASGFDVDKSFNIEVRVYDKLTQILVEITLNVGTPLIEYYRSGGVQGISINKSYDPDLGSSLQTSDAPGGSVIYSLIPTGGIVAMAMRTAPTGFYICNGNAISRTDYADLFNVIAPEVGEVTISIASPAVLTAEGHGLVTGDKVYLETDDTLPTGLSANTIYYAVYIDVDTFSLASSFANANAGTKKNTSGSQSGTHTITYCPFGLGDGSTTFNVPNLTGKVIVGYNAGDAEFDTLGVASGSGEKTHTLTTAELASHTHTLPSNTMLAQVASSSHNSGIPATGPNYNVVGTKADASPSAENASAGSGTAHNNLQPYLVLKYIIKT